MEAYELGQVNAFLLKHRVVEAKPRQGRKLRSGEKEIAAILCRAEEHELSTLRSILAGQGMHLIIKDDFDLEGIPVGGQVFLAVREQSEDAFIKVGEDMICTKMKLRDSESNEEVVTWYLYLWFQHLALLYSQIDRCITETIRYSEAEFSKSTFNDLIAESINDLRKSEMAGNQFYGEYLISERKKDLPRRISKFLSIMVESGMLELTSRSDDEIYRQTLLSSIEISESFEANMDALVPKGRDIIATTILPKEYMEEDYVVDQ